MAEWLSTDNLDRLDTDVLASVYAGAAEAPTWHKEVSMAVPSTTRSNTYAHVVDPTRPRVWEKGTPRRVSYVSRGSHEVFNITLEKTVGIHRHDLEDDTHTQTVIRELIGAGFEVGNKFALQHDVMAANVLIENGVCVDESPLFGDHPINPLDAASETYTNDFPNMPLTPENIAKALGIIGKIKGPDGYPMKLRVTKALVPSMLEQRAEHFLGTKIIGATENPLAKKGITVTMAPELQSQSGYVDGDEVWHLIAMAPGAMAKSPIIHQTRQALKVVTRFDPRDPRVFDMNEYLWGAEERLAIAAGYPFTIFRFHPGAIPS
jgi:phage major head subunit gpT-like protein